MVVALQETHLRDEKDLCQEMKDLGNIYNFYHSYGSDED
jgi:hypothetical protein